MLHYVDNVLTPYPTGTRAELGLSPDQIALIICDVFALLPIVVTVFSINVQQTMCQLDAQENYNL